MTMTFERIKISNQALLATMFIMLAFVLLACSSDTAQEIEPSNQENDYIHHTAPYQFSGTVIRGESYEKKLNNDLKFKLIPEAYADEGWIGWFIHIGPASERSPNYAGIVTPPFRGTNTLHILGFHFRNADNTGPNDGSANYPQETRNFSFVLHEEDYQRASDVLECILWPPLCEDITPEEAIEIHRSISIKKGTLIITHLELGNLNPGERAWIEYMEFDVTLEIDAEQAD
jgi:hypothetical protein